MIELRSISKTFRKGKVSLDAVNDVSLLFPERSITALIGPSGCGKSTLLNMIAGLYPPTRGAVYCEGQPVTDVNTTVGYMTQKDNLLPWRTVLDNVVLPLELAGAPKGESRDRAREMLQQVGLDGFEGKYSSELSGGMRKRACLARMLLYKPGILLLDEPFAALDAQLRIAMHRLLLDIWARNQQTIILVTHDLVEAVTLADRVIVFSPRPASVVHEEPIELARPRDVMQIRFTSAFQDVHNAIWERLRRQYVEENL